MCSSVFKHDTPVSFIRTGKSQKLFDDYVDILEEIAWHVEELLSYRLEQILEQSNSLVAQMEKTEYMHLTLIK